VKEGVLHPCIVYGGVQLPATFHRYGD
jgi:hypothetical protein